MVSKHIIEIYDNILDQIKTNVGIKVNITYPRGTDNIIVRDFDVTLEVFSVILSRRNKLKGGR